MTISRTIVLASVLLITACAGNPVALNDPSADARTGEMVVFLREPMVLQRKVPGLSARGRDFVYLAPVATNHQGVRKVFLWVGFASTIDREITRSAPFAANSIRVPVGDENLVIPLLDWHESAPPAPKTSVKVDSTLRSALTTQDFDRLVAAKPSSVQLLDGERSAGVFHIRRGDWDEWRNLQRDTAVGLGVEVEVATRESNKR